MKKKICIALLVIAGLCIIEFISKLEVRENISMIRGPNNSLFLVVEKQNIDEKIDKILTRFILFFDFFSDISSDPENSSKVEEKNVNKNKNRKNNRHKRK